MQKITRQWSVGAGILFLFMAALCAVPLIVMIIIMPKPDPDITSSSNNSFFHYDSEKYFSNYYVVPLIFSILFIFLFLALGIISLYKGIQCSRVKKLGYKTTCEITKVVQVRYYRSYRYNYRVDVKYKGQSGDEHTLIADIPSSRVDEELEKGMRLNCYVYEDDCFLDFDDLKPVKKEQIDDIE